MGIRIIPSMDEQTAVRWVRRGAVWATLIGLLDLLIWFAIRENPSSPFAGTSWIDALIMFTLAAGMYMRYRVAAVLLVLYWVYAKIFQVMTVQRIGAVLGLLVFGWVFWQTARAVFYLHKVKSRDVPASAAV